MISLKEFFIFEADALDPSDLDRLVKRIEQIRKEKFSAEQKDELSAALRADRTALISDEEIYALIVGPSHEGWRKAMVKHRNLGTFFGEI